MRLRHVRPLELGGINVTHDYAPVLTDDPRRVFVKVMTASVGDLGVNGRRSLLVSRSLRRGKLGLKARKVTRVLDLAAVTQGGKVFQAKVNADFASPTVVLGFDLTNEIEIPAATGIAGERTATRLTPNRPRKP